MPTGPREVARRVLRRVERDGAYANLALSAELRRARLSSRDRGLATELTYGVLRQRRLLDHALSGHCTQPLARLNDEALQALRLAAYQLLMLDRVPAHAAVNDAVEAVRAARGRSLAGFANAVLRRLDPGDLERDLPADPLAELALRCSLPDWLARRWTEQLGLDEARRLGEHLLRTSPLTARVNSLRGDPAAARAALKGEGAELRPGPLGLGALQIRRLDNPFGRDAYLEGLWTAQDEAAQAASRLLDPRPGERVLDACAGVGGKSTHLAAFMEDRGELLCVDRSARKLELHAEHCLRLGVSCARPMRGDLLDPALLQGVRVDRALLDAPCSGLGVLGRHPELKWRAGGQAKIGELAGLQRRMLERVVAALRPGGTLVYAVCTTTEEEGPQQLRWLLERYPDLRPSPPRREPLAGLVGEGGALRLWPHRHGCDGFFVCRLERTAA